MEKEGTLIQGADRENEEELFCPGCGLAQDAWPEDRREGYVSAAGERYCCRDCAEGRDCSCSRAQVA